MNKMRKQLSGSALLAECRDQFKRVKDPLAGKTKYSLIDCLMSGLAVFGLKYPSLLQFEQSQDEEKVRYNLRALYGVEKAPSDTYLRERLDAVDPKRLNGAFKACFSAVQRGKELFAYQFLEGYYLVSSDGTGVFYSDNVHCEQCCVKKHRDGGQSYYHQVLCAVMVHPRQSVVLPMTLESILKQDGSAKNDCEQNAAFRLMSQLRTMHPKLKMAVVEDALYSNAPHIKHLRSLDYQYIIGVKPTSHRWLFDWVNAGGYQSKAVTREGYQRTFRWMNDVALNGENQDVRVNFLECTEISSKGKKQTFSWVTGFHLNKENVDVVMEGARARWKIENETFNTLKTQGYHFEHNFGHGYQHLSTVMSSLMLLAFLIDQIQQLCCPRFQAALRKCHLVRTRLWEQIRHWFLSAYIDSWEAFLHNLVTPPDIRFQLNSS